MAKERERKEFLTPEAGQGQSSRTRKRFSLETVDAAEQPLAQPLGISSHDGFSEPEGIIRGHNKARVIQGEGGGKPRYYRKITTQADFSFTSCYVSPIKPRQHLEVVLHEAQCMLMSREILGGNYLRFRAVGEHEFELEIKNGACDLKEFINQVHSGAVSHRGYIKGLATAIMLRELLSDGDNKLSNYLVVPKGRGFFAISIDGEKFFDRDRFVLSGANQKTPQMLGSSTAKDLVGTIRKEGVETDKCSILEEWIDPKEIQEFLGNVRVNEHILKECIIKNFSARPELQKKLRFALSLVDDVSSAQTAERRYERSKQWISCEGHGRSQSTQQIR